MSDNITNISFVISSGPAALFLIRLIIAFFISNESTTLSNFICLSYTLPYALLFNFYVFLFF